MCPSEPNGDVEQTYSVTLWVDDMPYLTVGVFALDRDEAAWSGAVEISRHACTATFARLDEVKAKRRAKDQRRRDRASRLEGDTT